MRRNKYSARKVVYDGQTFDSKRECERYLQLCMLERAGEIYDLQRQVKFVLIPEQREEGTVITRGIHKGELKQGKLLERECAYYADFVYYDSKTDKMIVEDSKGFRTKDFLIKKKLLLYVHGISLLLT